MDDHKPRELTTDDDIVTRFQCPQFPLPLTPFLAVSAANAELANLPYLLLVQDALKILAATVRAGILSSRPAAETAAGAPPASEARVAEMLATAGSEAGIPQDLFADDAHILVGDRVREVVLIPSRVVPCGVEHYSTTLDMWLTLYLGHRSRHMPSSKPGPRFYA